MTPVLIRVTGLSIGRTGLNLRRERPLDSTRRRGAFVHDAGERESLCCKTKPDAPGVQEIVMNPPPEAWMDNLGAIPAGTPDTPPQNPPSTVNPPPPACPASGWPMVLLTEYTPPELAPPPPSIVNQSMVKFCARSVSPPGFGCARLAALHPEKGKTEGGKTIYRMSFNRPMFNEYEPYLLQHRQYPPFPPSSRSSLGRGMVSYARSRCVAREFSFEL